jgi:hypothetical protein
VTHAEILTILSDDSDRYVRNAVENNPNTPAEVISRMKQVAAVMRHPKHNHYFPDIIPTKRGHICGFECDVLTVEDMVDVDAFDGYEVERMIMHLGDSISQVENLDLLMAAVMDLKPLSRLKNLERLRVRDVDTVDLSPLCTLSKLRALDLNYWTNLCDVSTLAGITTIERLDLLGTNVTDLSPLAALPHATVHHDSGIYRTDGINIVCVKHSKPKSPTARAMDKMRARRIRPICQPEYSLLCGQTCLAMITGQDVEDIIEDIGHDGPTTPTELVRVLKKYGYSASYRLRRPKKTPRFAIGKQPGYDGEYCHWVLIWNGGRYDPQGPDYDYYGSDLSAYMPITMAPSVTLQR